MGKSEQHDPYKKVESGVEERCLPDGCFGAIGPFCPEILPDHCRRGVAQAQRGQQCKDHHAHRNDITGDRLAAKTRDHTH